MYVRELGCACVKIDTNGCMWVNMGALSVESMGNTKTKQMVGNKGLAGPDLGPMAG